MRDSEFHQSARGKPDSTQLKMTNYSPDLSSFIGEDDFVELLWENGPVVAQGQSNRNKKSSMVDRVSRDLVDRSSEKDTRDVEFPKAGRLEIMNSFMHNFSLPGPSNNVQLNAQYDELAPWMNYQVDDAIPTDYCSEFLSDVPGNNLSSLSVHSNSTPVPRTSGFCHTFKGFGVENGSTSKLLEDSSDPNRARFSQCYELLHQNQESAPSTKSRDEVFCIAGGNGSQQGPSGNWDCTRLEKHDPTTAKTLNQSSIGVMNFSHFSRPVALAKANLHSVERLKSIENPSTATSSKTMESTVIQSTTGCQTRTEEPSSPVTTKLDNKSSGKTLREMLPVEQSKVDCQKDTSNSNVRINYASSNCMSTDHTNHQSINFTKCLSLRSPEAERGHEPVVASSSVCSANSAGGASDEPKHQVKRKDQEIEESDNLSADLEDESVGQRKSASTKGTSAKRSRAAEVHNLSERRRRDRINEKMRALQELIPNCNKVDKASMLDEAIEYLKTLQLQVQMMSMGGGICMPPMMPPVGMQHMRMPPVAHFSQMGLGMGMGMRFGYAMGMIDMNGSPNCTLVPVPPMHSPQFRCTPASVPGPQGLSLMPGPTTLPVFGIPRQGQPMSITGAPSISCAPGLPATSNSVPEVPPVDATNQEHPAVLGPSSSCAEQKERNMVNCRANGSQGIQKSFKDSSIMRTNSKEMHTSENRDVN